MMDSTPAAKAAILLKDLRRTLMPIGGRFAEDRRIIRARIAKPIEDREFLRGIGGGASRSASARRWRRNLVTIAVGTS